MKQLFRAIDRARCHGWRYVEGGPGWQTLWHPNTRCKHVSMLVALGCLPVSCQPTKPD
jgi:hypothetical protein